MEVRYDACCLQPVVLTKEAPLVLRLSDDRIGAPQTVLVERPFEALCPVTQPSGPKWRHVLDPCDVMYEPAAMAAAVRGSHTYVRRADTGVDDVGPQPREPAPDRNSVRGLEPAAERRHRPRTVNGDTLAIGGRRVPADNETSWFVLVRK